MGIIILCVTNRFCLLKSEFYQRKSVFSIQSLFRVTEWLNSWKIHISHRDCLLKLPLPHHNEFTQIQNGVDLSYNYHLIF